MKKGCMSFWAYFAFVMAFVMTSSSAAVLPPKITAQVIRPLIRSYQAIFASHGVLVVPLHYRFAWRGVGQNEGWTFLGYTFVKREMFGINYESTQYMRGWNGRLLPDSQTVVITPERFQHYLKAAVYFKLMKNEEVNMHNERADAYLCIRIKPGAHRSSRPY